MGIYNRHRMKFRSEEKRPKKQRSACIDDIRVKFFSGCSPQINKRAVYSI